MSEHKQPTSVSTYIWGGLAMLALGVFYLGILAEFPLVVIPLTVIVIFVWRLGLGVRDTRRRSAQLR